MCTVCGESWYRNPQHCEKRCKPGDDGENCWTCSQNVDPNNCQNTCQAETDWVVNDILKGRDWEVDIDNDCGGWRTMIDKNGNFAQYEKVRVSSLVKFRKCSLQHLLSPQKCGCPEKC